eukprot:gene11840-biopygen4145
MNPVAFFAGCPERKSLKYPIWLPGSQNGGTLALREAAKISPLLRAASPVNWSALGSTIFAHTRRRFDVALRGQEGGGEYTNPTAISENNCGCHLHAFRCRLRFEVLVYRWRVSVPFSELHGPLPSIPVLQLRTSLFRVPKRLILDNMY